MTCTSVSNPTCLLISSLSEVFADVPRGSVIVAASDVLLLFRSVDDEASSRCEGIIFDQVDHCKVLGLSVPAPLSTAKNHGVFVSDGTHYESKGWNIQSAERVLQKPSLDEMKTTANCTFSVDGWKNQVAWIDTGVVCFLPKSAATIRDLSRSSLRCCTKTGLAELYGQGGTSHSTIESFAIHTSIKLCLYGDMLGALKTASSQGTEGPSTGTLAIVNKQLSQHEICICSYSSGSFVHLGTTRELVDFLTVCASVVATSLGNLEPSAWKRYQQFGKAIKLTRRANSFVSGLDTQADGHVVLNSVLTCLRGRLGANCVVEHCNLRSDEIYIGENSLVSGVRKVITGGVFSIGKDLCLQLLPVRQSWRDANLPASSGVTCYVCLCFGINDGIKDFPMETLYGVDLRALTRGFSTANERSFVSIKESDIWNENVPSSRRMLWNANVHPIIELDGKNELDLSWMSWINDLAQYGPGDETCSYAGFREWKSACRVSLSDVRNVVDSSAESSFRGSIAAVVQASEEDRLRSWRRKCLGRVHEPINFDHVRDVLLSKPSLRHDVVQRALRALDDIASEGIQAGNFDIVGRVFMVTGILLSDLGARHGHDEEELCKPAPRLQEALTAVLEDLRAKSIDDIASRIGAIRDDVLSDPLQWGSVRDDLAVFYEKAASAMTQLCVCGHTPASSFSRVDPVPIEATVIASAPARIDCCGGWSDTPPVSFEFGGSVACLAVLVDDKLPLRAQCRVSKEFQGIILRTESRRLDNEALVASSKVKLTKVSDFCDFRDPTADATLLKCVLIQLGFISAQSISKHNDATLQPHLARFCQRQNEDIGLEITSTSLLPTGSGMGSSSILAGCILAAVAKCVGIRLKGVEDDCTDNGNDSLIHSVLMVEQLLSTGGGWQDNIGGLVGGLKLGRSDAYVFPLHTKVDRYRIPPSTIHKLDQRLLLAFSGKMRLAKNVLEQVLRRWASRQPEIVQTVTELVEGAPLAISCLVSGDIDGLASVMSNYWDLKIQMAGRGSGVQPDSIRDLLELLHAAGDIAGGTVCGAGGGKKERGLPIGFVYPSHFFSQPVGGFVALVTAETKSMGDLINTVDAAVEENHKYEKLKTFTWHKCTMSQDGLQVVVTNG